MAVIRPIGRPENKSECKAITYLAKHLPDDYVLYHNLELPAKSGLPYEYDIIVVGEYAVYAVEVKGYRGHIRGNAHEWRLASGAIHRSPIPLANKKAKELKSYIVDKNPSLNDVLWVQAIIVLTNDRARVHLNDPQAERVLHLDEAVSFMLDRRRLPVHVSRITRYSNTICNTIGHHFHPLDRRRRIGDYQVVETIGKNELYTLFLATHQIMTTQRYTLKVYSFNVDAGAEARERQQELILRDPKALHQLTGHPNIVQFHPPFPWEDNHIVLPLDWVEGYSLRGLLDEGIQMSFARKIDIVCQVAEGLRYAHAHGVFHRNVHPDNIIVPLKGPVKLVNFDCARVLGVATIAGQVGRWLDRRYAAPELWLTPGAVSVASEVYALGMVLFELLTGQPPCQKKMEIVAAGGLPRLPTQLVPDLASDVDEIVSRMCAYEAADRYGSIEEVIEDLRIIS